MVVYAEQIRAVPEVLAALARMRAAGKRVVLLHPGRSELAQAATSSHTGALAGNHAAMRLAAERAGVLGWTVWKRPSTSVSCCCAFRSRPLVGWG